MTQNSQYRSAEEIIEKIHQVLGRFDGYRTLHADGRVYRGSFAAYPIASNYCRAIHLNGAQIPATVRFSKGGGDPFARFNATVGMATRFYLPDGRVTNLVMLSQKLFIANSIEQFLELVTAAQPLSPGAGPNMDGLKAALAANPNSAAVFKMRSESLAPVSFARTAFHGVHAFRLLDAVGRETHARMHWLPVAGIDGQRVDRLSAEAVDVLFRELDDRLVDGPVAFELVLELAEAGDPLDDATALWPAERRHVPIGRLTIAARTSEAEVGDPVMNHDPTMLVDGIEPTNDPILQIRRGVYELSAAMRSKGWRATSAPLGSEAGGA